MKILSLSYFAEIWPHSFPEFAVLKSLNEKYNFKIDYLNCDSYFSSCAVHDSRQESFSNKVIKSNICKFCINTKNSYLKSSNLRSLRINDYIEQKDYKKIDKILKNIDPSNYLKKTVFGITFGKYTLFNYLIAEKKTNLNFSYSEFDKYKIRLKDTLKSLFAFNNLLKKNKYDYVTTFSTEYSLNRVCIELAKKKNIRVMNIHNGKHHYSKFKYLTFYEGSNKGIYYHANKNWKNFHKKTIYNENFTHISEWFSSSFRSETFMNYSPKFQDISIRKYFKIPKKYKKIVLVACSSADERLGDLMIETMQSNSKKCDSNVFKNDVDWAEWLVKNISKFKDTFFIVRFHPRSFSMKRNNKTVDSINKINRLSKIKLQNLAFDLPKDQISVYDYILEIDLLLISTSSLSFEFGVFGIPSLTYDKNLFYYNDDLCFSPKNKLDYLDKINLLLNKKNYNKKKIIVNSFRWLILQLNYEYIDISDTFNPPIKNFFFRSLNKLQKHIGYNFIIKYYLSKFRYPKNLKYFKNIFKNNLNSFFDISLKVNKLNKQDYHLDFKKCKSEMLKFLKNNDNLYNFYKQL